MCAFLPEQLPIHFSQALSQAGVWLWFESDLFAFLQQAAAATDCRGRDFFPVCGLSFHSLDIAFFKSRSF